MTRLLEQASAFRADLYTREGALMRRLAREGQSPEAMLIGCSDARVLPELIVGARPGDLFVLRNVGNIVPPVGTGEAGVGAAVEYAVLHLRVAHLIVCGHLDCAGIRGLDLRLDMAAEPYSVRWLEWARPAQTQVDACSAADPEERHQRIVQANVLLQLANLQTYDCVLTGVKAGKLALHGWVFDIETGQVWTYQPAEDAFELGG